MAKEKKRAWGSLRNRGNGNSWELRYPTLRNNGMPGPRKREIFKGTEEGAVLRLEELHSLYLIQQAANETRKARFDEYKQSATQISVDEVWKHCYLPEATVAPTTLKGYKRVYETHIKPNFGQRAILSITHKEVQGYLKKLTAGAARHVVVIFRIIWKAAEYAGIMRHSDNIMHDEYKVASVAQPSSKKANLDIYSEPELNQIIEECTDPIIQNFLILCGKGGLRPPEACGVRIEDLDFYQEDDKLWAVVGVRRNVVSVDKQLIIKDTKTFASVRNTIIAPPFARLLQDNTGNTKEWVLDDGCGRPLTSPAIREIWKRYITRTRHPYIPPKNLRNSYSTALRTNGMDEGAVYSLLGHTSSTMLREHYNRPQSKDLIQVYKRYQENSSEETLKKRLDDALAQIEILTSIIEKNSFS